MLQPGSDQYPGVEYLTPVIPFAQLPADNVVSCGVVACVGMGRVVILGQYAKTESPPNGEPHYDGTGVLLSLWLSPYALTALVPAGEAEWWPVTVIAPETVAGCTSNVVLGEVATFSFCSPETDDTVWPFSLDVSVPTHAQRLRICAAELQVSEQAAPGSFGAYALLSLDPGGAFGWTILSQAQDLPQ